MKKSYIPPIIITLILITVTVFLSGSFEVDTDDVDFKYRDYNKELEIK